MYLLSKNKEVQLSSEQKEVLTDVEEMSLQENQGSVVFLYGLAGCGKTILGLEAGRILASKRQQIVGGNSKVEVIFCADNRDKLLLNSVKERHFLVDENACVMNIEEMLEHFFIKSQ